MSPKKPVLPLSCLCIKLFSTQLVQALSDDEGEYEGIIENYLLDVTYEVVQNLLKAILNSVNLDAATRFSCLEVLLRCDVKKLNTGMFPHSYYEKILKIIKYKGVGLEHLNLKGVWVRDQPTLLSQLIRSLSKLKVLIIPHMADDSVLEAAILSCKRLSVLDISGECGFTGYGLKKLLKSDTITVLDIGSFGKKDILCREEAESGIGLVAEIIENLPNLTILRTYSFTGSALLELHLKPIKRKTNLIYLHDTNTTNPIIKAIINLCPNLESVHIDSPDKGVLNKLVEFRKLNCLKLTRAGKSFDEFMNYLKGAGSRLEILKLNHNKIYSLDLSEIGLYAPNLQTLECFQMKLSFLQSDTYFMSLQNVEILYCDIADTTLKSILSNSPLLKRIIIGSVIQMTDGDIFRLCAECDFMNLEELWFSHAGGLTIISVELLMNHCPNLKVIGQLNGWDVSQDEVDYLRSVILCNNIDLTLLPLDVF